MTFTKQDQLTTLAIINVFETGRPLGGYASCVVLDDGAGISYGICQFTHRSGSLAAVVEAYLAAGGRVGAAKLGDSLPMLRRRTTGVIAELEKDEQLKTALRAAGVTREMKAAQARIAFDLYLAPALRECETRSLTLPLSLAVVCDSIVHGSFERIAARVAAADEKAWITDYVRKRHLWLRNLPRLRPTSYRTTFFLEQIAIGNWELKLPFTVHGVRVGGPRAAEAAEAPESPSAAPPAISAAADPQPDPEPTMVQKAGTALSFAAEKLDAADETVTAVASRTDSAKSLWATVGGTVWQAAWAVFGFVTGLPREVWIVVALIAAALILFYLYRQLVLGRIREVSVPGAVATRGPLAVDQRLNYFPKGC